MNHNIASLFHSTPERKEEETNLVREGCLEAVGSGQAQMEEIIWPIEFDTYKK